MKRLRFTIAVILSERIRYGDYQAQSHRRRGAIGRAAVGCGSIPIEDAVVRCGPTSRLRVNPRREYATCYKPLGNCADSAPMTTGQSERKYCC